VCVSVCDTAAVIVAAVTVKSGGCQFPDAVFDRGDECSTDSQRSGLSHIFST